MESSSSSDSIKKFVVFVCKICQDEYLDLKEFILHKRAHAAAAAAAAELAQTNQAEKQNVTPTDSQSDTSSDMDTDSQKEEELTPNSDTGTDASVPVSDEISTSSEWESEGETDPDTAEGEEPKEGKTEVEVEDPAKNQRQGEREGEVVIKDLAEDTSEGEMEVKDTESSPTPTPATVDNDQKGEEESSFATQPEIHFNFKLPFKIIQNRSAAVNPTKIDEAVPPKPGVGAEAKAVAEPTSPLSNHSALDAQNSPWLSPAGIIKPITLVLNHDDESILDGPQAGSKEGDSGGMTIKKNESSKTKSPPRSQLNIHPVPNPCRSRRKEQNSADIYAQQPCSVCGKRMKGTLIPPHRRLYHPEVKPFQCFECPFKTSTPVSLSRHRSYHRKKSAFQCPFCTISYKNRAGIDGHMKTVHSMGYQRKTVQMPRPMTGNPKSHHVQTVEPQSQSGQTPDQMKINHGSNCQGQALTAFPCRFCGKRFFKPYNQRYHELTHTRPFRCNHCPYTSGREIDLRNHKIRIHKDGGKLDLDAEGEGGAPTVRTASIPSFQRTTTGATPTQICHAKEYKCRYCGKVLANSSSFRNHENSHTRPFKCTRCQHRFEMRTDLKRHEARGHCSQTDSQNQTLLLDCSLCNLKFQSNTQLVQHFRLKHPGFKPYKCKECPYGSFAKALVERHAILHSIRQEFDCPYCSASFSRTSNLEEHVRNVHSGETGAGAAHNRRQSPVFHFRPANAITIQPVPARKAAVRPPGFYNQQMTTQPVPARKAALHPPGFYNQDAFPQQPQPQPSSSKTIYTHSATGNWGLQCPHCDYTSFHPASMTNHMMRLHSDGSGKGTFNCPDCSASFVIKTGLETHQKHSHPTPKEIRQVPELTPSLAHASQEVPIPSSANVRRSPKPMYTETVFKCRFCETSLPNRKKLKRHENSHTRPFPCPECPRAFACGRDLRRHLRKGTHSSRMCNSNSRHHVVCPNPTLSAPPPPPQGTPTPFKKPLFTKTFSCTICKNEFSRIEDLETHAQLDCSETDVTLSKESNANLRGSGNSRDLYQGNRITCTSSASTATGIMLTGERLKRDTQVTEIKITQQNEEGLKITSVRFI